MKNLPIKRALISVSNKQGVVEFAKQLVQLGIEVISTGGTAALLRDATIAVTDISDITQFPEIMDGRVKTLHPKVHGAILGRRNQDDAVMAEHDITGIDLVVVNLYPFQQVTAHQQCDLETAIEHIDIGGPAMLRAAAKNYQYVTAVVDQTDYADILAELKKHHGSTTLATRFKLAQKAFAHTAQYDIAVARYLSQHNTSEQTTFPHTLTLQFQKQQDLRYGENPHQQAAFYIEQQPISGTVASAIQHQGKPLSYNNINDTDTALACVKSFTDQPACVIVKHANPCGVALGLDIVEAYERAFACDSTSAFGGIIAFNQTLSADCAEKILHNQFAEVIIAPNVSDNALTIFNKKPNLRVLSCGELQATATSEYHYQRVQGGILVQTPDNISVHAHELNVVTKRQPQEQAIQDCLFAWRVVKFVKSNAIVYAKKQATLGIGAGQMSRIMSTKIAALKAEEAGLDLHGAVMASDAFFPFGDSVTAAAKLGISTIIQPGGSIRDEEVIAAANQANIAMIFTNIRHFRH